MTVKTAVSEVQSSAGGRSPRREGGSIFRGELRSTSQPASASEIQSSVESLKSLPKVVTDALALIRSPNATASAIEACLRQDFALTGKLLKLANSAAYARSSRVNSIKEAATRVGLTTIKTLVLAASSRDSMLVDVSPYGFAPQGLWQHSYGVASVARRVCMLGSIGSVNAESGFVSGLFKRVGMVVLAPLLARRRVSLATKDTNITQHEQSLFQTNHRAIAGQLAAAWQLSPEVVECLSNETPAVGTMARALGDAVLVAEFYVNRLGVGLLPEHPFGAIDCAALSAGIGLDEATSKKIETELLALINPEPA
jgi:HD-like signal output (HDOD) protein